MCGKRGVVNEKRTSEMACEYCKCRKKANQVNPIEMATVFGGGVICLISDICAIFSIYKF